jgi:hypothetical protein
MRCHVVRPFFLWPVLFLVAVAVCSSFLASIWISRYCVSILVRGTETLVGKLAARLGRYFRTVFGVQFGPGAFETLTPLMVSVTWSRLFTEVHWQCQKCEIRRLIKCLCHCGFQRIVHLLKPSIVTVIHDFFYVRAWQSKLSQSKQGREWVGDFISRFLVLHSDYSSASRDSMITLHWSLFRQITQAVCVGLLSGVRGDVELPTKRVLHSYVIRNKNRRKTQQDAMRTTLGRRYCWNLLDGAGVCSSTHWSIDISSDLPHFRGSVS